MARKAAAVIQDEEEERPAPPAAKPVAEEREAADAGTTSDAPEQYFQDMDVLTNHGISAADIKKLKEAGFHTLQSLVMNTKKDLCNVKGISEAKLEKILQAAMKDITGDGFVTGTQYLEKRDRVVKLTTGSATLDAMLGGGVETMGITEIFGEFRTGKTQLCHTLAVTCQMPENFKGGNGKCIYIDTEGTFRPERIAPIATRFGLDPAQVLENILVARVHTHERQMDMIAASAAKLAEERFSLLIVDSVMALFRVDFSGRGELSERQQKLGKMLSKLIKTCEEFNVACVITNQVMADPGGTAMFMADPKKPVGGHVLAHASTTRLYLKKGRGETRVCKIYDSPNLPEVECLFQIANEGIIDAKE